MSMQAELEAAQISPGLSFPQYIGTSHTYNHGPPPSSPPDLLTSLNIEYPPTEQQLYALKIHLDHFCLQCATNVDDHFLHHTIPDVNRILAWAIKLSSRLCKAIYPRTFIYQELQLRALVSCLSLLHYSRVQALHQEQWDTLKRTKLQDIAFQLQPDSILSQEIRHAGNAFLLRLASQYLSFIQRGDSNLPLVVGPILNIFWGSVAVVSMQEPFATTD